MKKRELIKILSKEGCELLRHGANHDIYINPITGKREPVPRHKEIDENLAKKSLKTFRTKNNID